MAPTKFAGRAGQRWLPFLFAGLSLSLFGLGACPSEDLPPPPPQCDEEGVGCLSDEKCVNGECVLLDRCEADDDCPSSAWRCVFPAQVCEIRPGFDEECRASTDCEPGNFCALGKCRALADAKPCARRSDCPLGQGCDRQNFLCIEEAPCTLAEDYPEAACDPGEVCELGSGRCSLSCQDQCTPETEVEDCGLGSRCDSACRCVQCLSDSDCGLGLLCNVRAGRCESEDLCYEDDDCESPLICDPRTALCQVPLPPCESDTDCEIAEICNRTTGQCELPGGACIDDRYENADTPATAEAIALDSDGTPRLLDDLRLCPNDDDVYAFALSPGDELSARIAGTNSQARATAWLLDAEGETSLRFAEAPPYGNGRLTFRAREEETVYLRLNALLGQTPYDLELSRTAGQPCALDAFEGATGNDSLENASPPALVPLDATLIAEICPGDVDYLSIQLEAGEGLEATLSFDEASTDLDLTLFSASTGAQLAQSAGLFEPERLRYRSPQSQVVVLRVQGYGNQDGAYSLALQKLPVFECTPDDFEPDNTPEQAQLWPAADAELSVTRTLCRGDTDMYRVPLEDFQRLVASASFAPADLDMQIELLDESGENVLRISPDSAGGETLSYNAAANETVLLALSARFNTSAEYGLQLLRENQFQCTADQLEPNDNTADAAEYSENMDALTLCGSDQDIFRIDGVGGKRLRARIDFLHSDGDLDLMILGLDGQQILSASDGVGDTEETSAELPLDGTYFVRVFSLSTELRSRYRIELALEDN